MGMVNLNILNVPNMYTLLVHHTKLTISELSCEWPSQQQITARMLSLLNKNLHFAHKLYFVCLFKPPSKVCTKQVAQIVAKT